MIYGEQSRALKHAAKAETQSKESLPKQGNDSHLLSLTLQTHTTMLTHYITSDPRSKCMNNKQR